MRSRSHLFTGISISDMYFNTQLMIFFKLSSPNFLEMVCRGRRAQQNKTDRRKRARISSSVHQDMSEKA